jgi:hypothetical protein
MEVTFDLDPNFAINIVVFVDSREENILKFDVKVRAARLDIEA